MQTLIVQPKDRKQLAAVKAALKALGVPFKKERAGQYDPEFVAKIQKSRQEIKEGKVTRVEVADLKKFLSV